MSVLRVRLVGETVLRKPATKVIDAKYHQPLIDAMFDTLRQSKGGVALAAPQVGASLRLFVFAQDPRSPKVFINPEIESLEGTVTVPEGCLSIPGFYPEIVRAERVRGTALNRWGESITFDEDDLLGHVIQHEIDHLDGVLTLDRLQDKDREELLYRLPPELHRLRKGIRAALQHPR